MTELTRERAEPTGADPTGAGSSAGTAAGRIELAITGMTCAACASRIEKKLNKLTGAQAVVNFATERAVVTGLPVEQTEAAVQAVTKAGYRATPIRDDTPEPSNAPRLRSLRRRILVAALLTLPLSNLTIALALVPSLRFPMWEWLCVLIATPVVTWAAWPFHRATLRNLRHHSFSMDILVSLGVASAYGWSVLTLLLGTSQQPGYWLGWGITPAGADALYLEVAAAVTTFLLIGRYFETRARGAATDVLGALRALAASSARVRRADGREVVVPLGALSVADVIVVRPGETVPVDGVVAAGRSSIDTSTMTGEPTPRDVAVGDAVMAGTINLNGALDVSVERVGAATQLEQMAALAEQAQARKARVQRLVDRVVSVFVPAVLIIAALTLGGWLIAGAPVRSAFSAALSVLIIACPCSLGLATPTALMVGVGRAGQLGIVVKGPDAFEASGEVDTVVLDKTGTLTTGELKIDQVIAFDAGMDVDAVRRLGHRVEHDSEHPVGRALAVGSGPVGSGPVGSGETEPAQPASLGPVQDFQAYAGLGVSARAEGRLVRIGSLRWLAEVQLDISARAAGWQQEAETSGRAIVFLAVDDVLTGAFLLTDTIKPSALAAVAELKAMGLRTVLLSGDVAAAADAVGRVLGVDAVVAGVLPTQKAAAIESLQAESAKRGGGKVAMVGDGINDAAALATADLGLAVLNGTDLAMRSADIILVRPHLGVIADAVALSRRTLRTIRGNLIWAFGYNVAAIPLAASGWLNPLIAGFAMSFSSLFVVANSLRLRHFSPARGTDGSVD